MANFNPAGAPPGPFSAPADQDEQINGAPNQPPKAQLSHPSFGIPAASAPVTTTTPQAALVHPSISAPPAAPMQQAPLPTVKVTPSAGAQGGIAPPSIFETAGYGSSTGAGASANNFGVGGLVAAKATQSAGVAPRGGSTTSDGYYNPGTTPTFRISAYRVGGNTFYTDYDPATGRSIPGNARADSYPSPPAATTAAAVTPPPAASPTGATTGGATPTATPAAPVLKSGLTLNGRKLPYGAMVNGVPTFSDGSGGIARTMTDDQIKHAGDRLNIATAPLAPLASDALGYTPSSAQMADQNLSQLRRFQPITGSRPSAADFAAAERNDILSGDWRSAAGTVAHNLPTEPGIRLHENIESHLMHELGFSYQAAHAVAQASENHYVAQTYGVHADKYQKAMEGGIEKARQEAPGETIPADLDGKPYADAGVSHLLKNQPATEEHTDGQEAQPAADGVSAPPADQRAAGRPEPAARPTDAAAKPGGEPTADAHAPTGTAAEPAAAPPGAPARETAPRGAARAEAEPQPPAPPPSAPAGGGADLTPARARARLAEIATALKGKLKKADREALLKEHDELVRVLAAEKNPKPAKPSNTAVPSPAAPRRPEPAPMPAAPYDMTAEEVGRHADAVTRGERQPGLRGQPDVHDVRMADVERLPELLEKPVMVMKSRTQPDSVVAIVDAKDMSGRPVVVALHTDKVTGATEIHRIASVYGKDGAAGFVREDLQRGRLLYRDSQKSPEWLRSMGLQLPGDGAARGSWNTVPTEQDFVKSGAGFDKSKATDTPEFKQFFGTSKVVDEHGEPLPMYHGTAEDFSVFGDDRTGEATGHATSPLGHFFTPDRAQAEGYARNASDGRPADERVVDAYLSIQKPYTMSLEQAQRIETPGMARAVRAQLEAKGYDGIHLPEQNAWVAFHGEQIKSASENLGTFDAKNPNIYFDKSANVDDSGQPDRPDERRPFSHASESIETMGTMLPRLDDSLWQRVKDYASGKLVDLKPFLLGGLQLRHLLELAKSTPEIKDYATAYANHMQRMDADRNKMQVDGAAQVNSLNDWAYEKGLVGWRGKLKAEARQLFRFQHEATQAGIDPAEAYSRLKIRDHTGQMVDWTPEMVKERIAVIREQMRGRAGDAKDEMLDKIKELAALKYREADREAAYARLRPLWEEMTPKQQAFYRMQRDHYREQAEQLHAAVEEHIDNLPITPQGKAAQKQLLNDMFEEQQSTGVYFPLQRYGDYWISGKLPAVHDANDEGTVLRPEQRFFTMYESAKEAARAERQMLRAGYQIDARGMHAKDFAKQQAPSGSFLRKVQDNLKAAGAPEDVRDQINQMYLKTLPELSLRKRGIHRFNVAGYTDNASRVFATSVLHGSHQIARARFGWRMGEALDGMKERLEAMRGKMDVRRAASADALLGELDRRHQWVMNPTSNKAVTKANAIGFAYYLSASPASALVNFAQTPMITLPVLAAQHGWDKAGAVLMGTVKDAIATGGDLRRTLKNDEERAAFDAMQNAGTFTRTQTHTLGGVADDNALQMHPVWSKVLNAMGYLFQKAEVVNRTSAGMAAFRLARMAGKSYAEALQHADDVVNGTHFDYSNANRSRWMQGNVGKLLGQFKSYSVGMTWLYGRTLDQALRGETPEVKRVARRTLTGILGMTSLFAGVMGLPIANLMRAAGNAYNAAFGDDNQPYDFDTEFHGWLADHLGTTAANTIAYGPVSQLTRADVSRRLSSSELWIRDTDQAMTGEYAYIEFLEQMAGPLGGITQNLLRGADQYSKGYTERGIETMMPTAIKNVMKGARYATQGVNTLQGAPILDDISGPETFMQAIGFQPTRVAEQQRTNSALTNSEKFINSRRQALMNAYAMASTNGSGEDQNLVLDKIQDFNRTWPQAAISASSLHASMQSRARSLAETVDGLRLNRRLDAALRAQAAAP